LLAGNAGPVTAAAADRAFFYDARLKAAQSTTDARSKLLLLGNALADTPFRDDARVPLFQAAASQEADEYALAVLEPLLHQQFLNVASSAGAGEEEQIVSSDEEDNAQTPSYAYASIKLPAAQQTQVSLSVGYVLIRLDRLNEALPYLQLARKLEKGIAQRKEIEKRIADVRSSLRRQKLNAARQPILHQELEQDRVVRPRLVARIAPPAKPAAKGGVTQ
jgi:hypothetical protein